MVFFKSHRQTQPRYQHQQRCAAIAKGSPDGIVSSIASHSSPIGCWCDPVSKLSPSDIRHRFVVSVPENRMERQHQDIVPRNAHARSLCVDTSLASMVARILSSPHTRPFMSAFANLHIWEASLGRERGQPSVGHHAKSFQFLLVTVIASYCLQKWNESSQVRWAEDHNHQMQHILRAGQGRGHRASVHEACLELNSVDAVSVGSTGGELHMSPVLR
jgi:hypothetical protein